MDSDSKRKRLLEAAAAILAFTPEKRLNITVLNKALFYLDLTSLRDFGSPISHNTFVALEQGPVVAKYPQRLVNALVEEGIANQESFEDAKPVVLNCLPSHLDFIDSNLEKLVQNIARWFSEKTSKEASDFAHQNPGWMLAHQEGLAKSQPAKPINLYIAMQQIVVSDPWMDSSYTLNSEAISAADRDEGVPW
ncbi:MAG: Panacea domain-containing protein [Cyanobacteria bacterium P01_D01_bin.71]